MMCTLTFLLFILTGLLVIKSIESISGSSINICNKYFPINPVPPKIIVSLNFI